MKSKCYCLYRAAALALAAGVLFSCGDDDSDNTPKPGPGNTTELTVTAKNVTKDGASIQINSSNPDATYAYGVVTKAEYDQSANAQAFIDTTVASYSTDATEAGKDLETYLTEKVLAKGNILKDFTLEPGTEYVAYAFCLTAKGVKGTQLFTSAFTTQEAPKGFTIDVDKVTSSSVSVSITPDDPEMTYYCDVFSSALMSQLGSDADFLEAIVAELVDMTGGKLGDVLSKGNDSFTASKLTAQMGYNAVAFGLDAEGNVTTPLYKEKFQTEKLTKTEAKFTVTVSDLTAVYATLNIEPEDKTQKYFWDILPKDALKNCTTDEDYADLLFSAYELYIATNQFEAALSTGDTTESLAGMIVPETDYVICAFGYNKGISTTIHLTEFTTPAVGDISQKTLTIELGEIKARKVSATVLPEDNSFPFFAGSVTKESFDKDYGSDAGLTASIQKELNQIAEQNEISVLEAVMYNAFVGKTEVTANVTPNTECYMFAFALDVNTGAGGPVTKELFTTPEAVPSQATVALESTIEDGNTYYNLDPTKFAQFKDKAAAWINVKTTKAAHFYMTVFIKEVDNESDPKKLTPDQIIAELTTPDSPYVYTEKDDPSGEFLFIANWGESLWPYAIAEDADGNLTDIVKKEVIADRSLVQASIGALSVGRAHAPIAFCSINPADLSGRSPIQIAVPVGERKTLEQAPAIDLSNANKGRFTKEVTKADAAAGIRIEKAF